MQSPHSPRSAWRSWVAAFVLFSALGAVWAVMTPVFNVPDEPAHSVYAAAAVRGEVWAPTDGVVTTVTVPAGFANAGSLMTCYVFQPAVPAGCAQPFVGQPGDAQVTTTAGRYPPLYYLYAGLGSLVAEGADGLVAMRLLTAVAVGALLASAACSVLAQRNRVLGLLGLGVATTPMLFFFAGSVNPQAPEIAAAILLWVSGTGLLRLARSAPDRRITFRDPDMRRVAVAAAVLTSVRPMSLVWLVMVVALLLLALATREAVRALLRSRALWVTVVVVGVLGLANAAWIVLRDALAQQDVTIYAGLSPRGAVLLATTKLDDEFKQMIGVFGWLDTSAPGITYLLVTLVLGALVLVGAGTGSRRSNTAVALTALAVVVVPVVLELRSYQVSAFAWQGRYTLPIAVGVPLLLALLPDHAAVDQRLRRRLAVAGTVALAVAHTAAFTGSLGRNVFGIDSWWGVSPPGWAPPLPAAVLVGAQALLTVAAVAAVVLATRPVTEEPARTPDGGTPAVDEDAPPRDVPVGASAAGGRGDQL